MTDHDLTHTSKRSDVHPPARDTNPGHRYSVIGIRHDGTEEVVGWTDHADGGKLAEGVSSWPRFEFCRVEDTERTICDARFMSDGAVVHCYLTRDHDGAHSLREIA